VDADGNQLWDKSFGGPSGDYLADLRQTADGGFILGGISYSGISGDKSSPSYGYQDFWLLKVDASGNKLWDKSFGGDNTDELYSLDITTDGGFVLTGDSWSGVSGNKTTANNGFADGWVVRVDAQGEKLWEKTLGTTNGEEFWSVQETADGGFILGGWSRYGTGGFWVVQLAPPPPTSLTLSVTKTGENLMVQLSGPPGTYSISASTNLVGNWVTIATVTVDENGHGSFVDPGPTTLPSQFYRGAKVE
jgi:hypothetical protein